MPQTSITIPSPGFGGSTQGYQLSDDLARLCLPSEFKDSYRTLAWVDSICLAFLLIGIIGLRSPKIVERPVTPPQEIVPVVFTPPEEQQKPQPVVKEEEPKEEQEEAPVEAPPIPTVVAANTPNVAFSIPVEGPVVLAPITRAAPPPVAPRPVQQGPKVFTGKEENGTFPQPSYPPEAAQQRMQGTVTNLVVVDASGVPSRIDVVSSSGHYVLDDYSKQWIKRRWRWLPGETRSYLVPFTWQLQ